MQSNTPTTPTDLASLIEYIHSLYQFTPQNYPALGHLPGDMRPTFVASHALMHMQKSIGALATQVEAADHSGMQPPQKNLREPLLKLMLNCLKLGAEIGLTEHDIVTGIPPLMKSKPA